MIDGCEPRDQLLIGLPAFDADHALTDRRQHLLGRQRGGGHVRQSEAIQAGARQQRGVDLAPVQLLQARADAAAEIDHFEIRPPRQDLRLTAKRRRADHGPLGQGGDAVRLPADQRIPGIGTLQHAGDGQAVRQPGRHVLHGMHAGIDAAVEQCHLDLFAKQPLAADVGERPVCDPVAGGADHHHLDGAGLAQVIERRHQALLDHVGLDAGERGTARAEADGSVERHD